MKKPFFRKTVFLLAFLSMLTALCSPLFVLAGDYQDVDGRLIHYEGLVPCGKGEDGLVAGEDWQVGEPCQLCHLFVMLDGILDLMVEVFLVPIVIFMVAIAGIMFFFAGTNPAILSKAKALMKSIVIGLLIIFSAYVIIGSFFTAVGLAKDNPVKDWFQGDGFTFICPIDYSDADNGGTGANGGSGNGGDDEYPCVEADASDNEKFQNARKICESQGGMYQVEVLCEGGKPDENAVCCGFDNEGIEPFWIWVKPYICSE